MNIYTLFTWPLLLPYRYLLQLMLILTFIDDGHIYIRWPFIDDFYHDITTSRSGH